MLSSERIGRRVKLHDLNVLMVVVQAGSMRKAAVQLNTTQPTVSRSIAKLEAAIGVRLRRWVSLHGISINVAPNLEHFSAIVPCGVVDPRYGVTSLADLGLAVTMADVDAALATVAHLSSFAKCACTGASIFDQSDSPGRP